jgi:hypothetical protein
LDIPLESQIKRDGTPLSAGVSAVAEADWLDWPDEAPAPADAAAATVPGAGSPPASTPPAGPAAILASPQAAPGALPVALPVAAAGESPPVPIALSPPSPRAAPLAGSPSPAFPSATPAAFPELPGGRPLLAAPVQPSAPGPAVFTAQPTVPMQAAGPAQPVLPQPVAAAVDPIAERPDGVWYVRPPSGGQYGPARGEIMRRWINEGRVSSDSLVWREGWDDWQSASETFPSLRSVITPPVPPDAAVYAVTSPRPASARPLYHTAPRRNSMSLAVVTVVLLGLLSVALLITLVLLIKK